MDGVKWIFFDVDSTLVDETAAYRRWAAEVLAGTDITPAEFETQRRRLAEAGDPGDGAVLARFGLSDVPWHPEEEVPFPDAAPALSELRRRGYSLGSSRTRWRGSRSAWPSGAWVDSLPSS